MDPPFAPFSTCVPPPMPTRMAPGGAEGGASTHPSSTCSAPPLTPCSTRHNPLIRLQFMRFFWIFLYKKNQKFFCFLLVQESEFGYGSVSRHRHRKKAVTLNVNVHHRTRDTISTTNVSKIKHIPTGCHFLLVEFTQINRNCVFPLSGINVDTFSFFKFEITVS